MNVMKKAERMGVNDAFWDDGAFAPAPRLSSELGCTLAVTRRPVGAAWSP